MIRSALLLLMFGQLFAAESGYRGKAYTGGDVFADMWVATDGAARTLPGFKECGPVKIDKWVGIFYWTWHIEGRPGPYDNSKILAPAHAGRVD